MPGKTFRHICFTLNNPSSDEIAFAESEHVRYAAWQREVREKGTPHLQGYIEFAKNVSMKAVKALVGKGAHLEERRGTREQAREYCKKEESALSGECRDRIVPHESLRKSS
jgi:hypothetical protein